MKRRQQAFTIIELLITVTILAVLVATAIPSFRTLIANNRSTSLANEFFVALNAARSEAIKRGARVSLCASSDGAGCTAAGTWQDGWIVFVDGAASDTAAPSVGANAVIRVWGPAPPGANLTVAKAATPISFVRFTGLGMLARAVSDTDPVDISVHQTGCQGNSSRQLEVGIAGRVNQTKTACP